jgi:hypothetical protein
MPQRRRRAHGFPRHAGRAGNLRLGLTAALVALGLVAAPATAAADTELDTLAEAIVEVFPDDEFCFLIPPRPLSGIFEPEGERSVSLARDHAFARRFETQLRSARRLPVVTLAPSYPFDATQMRLIEPTLLRILTKLLWLYADYWQAARAVVVEGTATTLPPLGLSPVRNACPPAVVLFVFTGEDGGLAAAGYMSLLTGRLLASVPPVD